MQYPSPRISTRTSLYEVLNRKYNSSSDYYEAYYQLQRNTAMKLADTNIVNGCTIYTENPTILTGGNVHRTDSVKDEYWYTAFQKLGKSTVLCIDPASSRLYLVRRLDYMNIDEGESFVCMEIDTNEITKAIDSLDFDGELYVISGSRLLFNGNDSITLVDDIATASQGTTTRSTSNIMPMPAEMASALSFQRIKSSLRHFLSL